MTEQQRPDEDVEGHGFKPQIDPEGVEEDVEGHKHLLEEGSVDDVAGHRLRDDTAPEGDEGDDVGGHQWTRQ